MAGHDETTTIEFIMDLDASPSKECAAIDIDGVQDADSREALRGAARHFGFVTGVAKVTEGMVVEDLMRCYAFADRQLTRIAACADASSELERETARRTAVEEKLGKILLASVGCLSRFERALEHEWATAVSYIQLANRCGEDFALCTVYLRRIHQRMEEATAEMEELHPRFVGVDAIYDDILERRRRDRSALLEEKRPKKPTWDIDI